MLSRYEQFSYIVSGINRHIQKLERDEMIKFGYKGAFAQYLVAMRHYPKGVTAAQLSEICDKDKAAVSRIVTEMIALVRSVSDIKIESFPIVETIKRIIMENKEE